MSGVTTSEGIPAGFKDAGIDWLPAIPSNWEAGNIRRYALMRTGHTPSRQSPEYWDDCTIPWFTLADVWQLRDGTSKYLGETKEKISEDGLANSAAELLPAGTVILSRTASVGFSGIMPTAMATTQDFWNWVCGPKLLPDYLLWSFRAMGDKIAQLTSGSTHKTIYQRDAASLEICVPPLGTQQRIAHFLDEKTARIDGLIEKKRSLLDRLTEKRQALITRAVTKGLPAAAAAQAGLNPDAPLKPSGIDWLGDIPAHWRLLPLKRLGQVRSGITKGKSYTNEDTLVLPYLRVANVQDGWLDLNEIAEIEVRVGDVQRYSLKDGDILMNEGGDNDKLGRGTVWRSQIAPCLHQNHVFAVRLDMLDPEWIARCTEAAYAKFHFFRRAVQSTNLASISRTVVADLAIPLPPTDEVARILKGLASELDEIAMQLDRINQTVGLLSEYRSALITAAVTGQIPELR